MISEQIPSRGFAVLCAADVRSVLVNRHKQVVDLVCEAYEAYGNHECVNPQSSFLTIPGRPRSRIIALPAAASGVAGIKWISSWPQNVAAGLPRASAVLILNDLATGFPFACMESSVISAARTAASAALAADRLTRPGERPRRVGFVGTGLIARYIHDYLASTGWEFDEVGAFDVVGNRAAAFLNDIASAGSSAELVAHQGTQELVQRCDLVVFATVAGSPHVCDPSWFRHAPLVLHISLRDLAPEVVVEAMNVVDDVEHCLREQTSLHLTEQQVGNRDFVDGSIYDVIRGRLTRQPGRTCVFSPFGLGILDLALASFVYDNALASGHLRHVDDFFDHVRAA